MKLKMKKKVNNWGWKWKGEEYSTIDWDTSIKMEEIKGVRRRQKGKIKKRNREKVDKDFLDKRQLISSRLQAVVATWTARFLDFL